MISVNDLSMHFGKKVLFENVSFQLNPGNKYGIVGANGSGKSTLLKILSREIGSENGDISIPNSIKLGILEQNHFQYEEIPILDVVLMGNSGLWNALEEKKNLDQITDVTDETGTRLAELETIINDNDGYNAEARASELLFGLGINTEKLTDPLSSLSGGYKLRVLMAQCLFGEPDVLYLDEPTNHLDILSIQWFERFLQRFKGLALIISHDEHFLNNISTHIMDIDYETIKIYPGNYSKFIQAKEQDKIQKEAEIIKQEKKKEDLEAFINRFKAKATKARQASSKAKQLDKIEDIVIKRSSRLAPSFDFKQVRPSGKSVLNVNNICKSYGENEVLKDLSFEINKGDKVAIIGPNGIGKSTLIKIIHKLEKQDSGTIETGYEVYPGYFPQDHGDLIDPESTPYEWLYSFAPDRSISEIRGRLGRVLLTEEDVNKPNTALSGGESSRLIAAKLMQDQPNLLLLDEPTNHMDLETIHSFGESLKAYEGTILCVSHNRYFIDHFATVILEISKEGYDYFKGNYSEFLSKKGNDYLDRELKAEKSDKKSSSDQKSSSQNWRNLNKEVKKLEKKVSDREKKIEKLEEELEKIGLKLAEPSIYNEENSKKLEEALKKQKELNLETEKITEEWESFSIQLEEAQSRLEEINP